MGSGLFFSLIRRTIQKNCRTHEKAKTESVWVTEMKRKTAKEILAESFMELAAARDIEKITIKDITDNCGYSPATFYRQFKDKYDLIAWDYAKEVEQNIG